VAHGVVIRVLLCSLLDGSGPEHFGRFAIDHTAVNDLRWDGARWRAEALGVAAEDLESFPSSPPLFVPHDQKRGT
jgi:broad specificity phosphatase PhoE